MKTPLCFQITEFDCGTTSALNAIKYLFHREEIPAALLQGIYAYTLDRLSPKGKPGEGGTSKQAMALLTNWLNEYSATHHFQLKCKYYQGEEVQENLLLNILRRGGIAIVRLYLLDTQHYVLITKKEAETYCLFDPYYLDESYTNPKAKIVVTLKLGFSVVAPMRVTHPRSTASSRESCWVLLNRWISSMKIIGLRAVNNPCSRLDFSIISLTSLIPLLIALSEKKAR